MSDFDDQVAFNIESETKEAAQEDLEHGELSQLLRQQVREIAFGEELSERQRIENRLEDVRQKKDDIRSQRRNIDAKIEQVETEEARLEERLEGLTTRDEQYDAALEMLEESLADGQRVFPGHGQVKRAAMLGDVDQEEVVDDLMERNPSVPEHAFVSGIHSTDEWRGFDRNA